MNINQAREIVAELIIPFNRDFFEFIEDFQNNSHKYSPIQREAVIKFESHVFNPAD